MTTKEIKQRMAERGVRQVDLAKRWKLRSGVINQLVNRQLVSKRLESRLARVIGVTLDELRGTNGKAA